MSSRSVTLTDRDWEEAPVGVSVHASVAPSLPSVCSDNACASQIARAMLAALAFSETTVNEGEGTGTSAPGFGTSVLLTVNPGRRAPPRPVTTSSNEERTASPCASVSVKAVTPPEALSVVMPTSADPGTSAAPMVGKRSSIPDAESAVIEWVVALLMPPAL